MYVGVRKLAFMELEYNETRFCARVSTCNVETAENGNQKHTVFREIFDSDKSLWYLLGSRVNRYRS
jgi:hypothetical protein